MGASLPAIVRWMESTPRGVSWWGLLYGGNTVGAVFGCLLAGFYLLRIYNMAIATFAAVAINLVVAAVSFALARAHAGPTPAAERAGRDARHGRPAEPTDRCGRSTSPSRFRAPARWAPKWSGRA